MFSKLLSTFTQKYQDPLEEKEYHQLIAPYIRDSLKWLFVFIALLFIPLTLRYFQKHLSPQNYLGICFIVFGVLAFIFRKKLGRCIELLSFIYVALIIILYIINMRLILIKQTPYEAFYMGYGFALVQRMLDYRVSNFAFAALFHVVFIILKFTLVAVPDPTLTVFVICLEIFPLIMGFKNEKAARSLFDSLYKAKQQFFMFKQLLTEYFPNQMCILTQNYSQDFFVNNSFKRLFSCSNIEQVKNSLNSLIIETETIKKNSTTLDYLGYTDLEKNANMTLFQFIDFLSSKIKGPQGFPAIKLQAIQPGSDVPESSPHNNGIVRFVETGNGSEDHVLIQNDLLLGPQNRGSSHQKDDFRDYMESPARFQQESSYTSENEPTVFQKRVWNVTIFPITWDHNEAIAVIMEDITHEKTIMELRLADKKKKDLMITMISHELKTPLNGVLGMIEIVRKILDKFEAVKQSNVISSLEACKNNSLLLLNLVNSIVDFSQIKTDKLRLNYTKVYISALLTKIKPLFDHFCKTKNLEFNMIVDPNVPPVIVTDRERLSQILITLLGNAFKFTFTGEIRVTVSLENQFPYRLNFSVKDTGVGIKEEDKKNLFRLFGGTSQEENMINTHGMGLGLTISDTLARLLNPKQKRGISYESEFSKGSLFSFIVEDMSTKKELETVWAEEESLIALDEQLDSPSVQDKINCYFPNMKGMNMFDISPFSIPSNKAMSEKTGEVISQDAHASERWCLLVDDNVFNISVARHLMEERGYSVEVAMNGKEAIEKAEEAQKLGKGFRVILMDCQMPVMDGYEATKVLTRMMKEGSLLRCPIIALTANAKDKNHDKLSHEAGMSGYVAKPLKIELLEKVLDEAQKKMKEIDIVIK